MTAICSIKASIVCVQGKKVHRSRTDIYALFKPLFQGVANDKPDCLVRMESKVRLHSCYQLQAVHGPLPQGRAMYSESSVCCNLLPSPRVVLLLATQ